MLLFNSQLFDLYALSNRTMRFKLMTESIVPEVAPFIIVLIIMYVGFGAALAVNSLQIPKADMSYMADDLWLLDNIGQFGDFGKAFESLFAASISCFAFEFIEFNIDSKMLFVVYIFIVVFLFVTMITGSSSAMCHAVSSNAERLCYKREASDVIELESGISIEERMELYNSFEFNKRVEFDIGDLGLPGCIQVMESVTAHRWTLERLDRTFRFAGDTNPKLPWPEDETNNNDDPKRKLKALIDDLTGKLGKTHGIMKNVTRKAKAWKASAAAADGTDAKATTTMTDSVDDDSEN